MHKNPVAHYYVGRLENTYPQDNYMDNYGEYFIGFKKYGYPLAYISKSNVGYYWTYAEGNGYTMTLVRPMIEYKEQEEFI